MHGKKQRRRLSASFVERILALIQENKDKATQSDQPKTAKRGFQREIVSLTRRERSSIKASEFLQL